MLSLELFSAKGGDSHLGHLEIHSIIFIRALMEDFLEEW